MWHSRWECHLLQVRGVDFFLIRLMQLICSCEMLALIVSGFNDFMRWGTEIMMVPWWWSPVLCLLCYVATLFNSQPSYSPSLCQSTVFVTVSCDVLWQMQCCMDFLTKYTFFGFFMHARHFHCYFANLHPCCHHETDIDYFADLEVLHWEHSLYYRVVSWREHMLLIHPCRDPVYTTLAEVKWSKMQIDFANTLLLSWEL